MTKKALSEQGKEQIALALILLKDFMCDGKFDVDVIKYIFELADHLEVRQQFDKLTSKIPPMKIVPRYD